MTKKKNEQRHIQNRAWEKDRRDRLNNTFEKLAKLLPEYRPKVTFSKIEILHKTIVYIEDLRRKLRDVLSTQNASILKTQEELEGSIKILVEQNNDLVELLEKSNIKVPHFIVPKFFSFIISVYEAKSNKKNDTKEKREIVDIKSTNSHAPNENVLNKRSPEKKSKNKSNKTVQSPAKNNKETIEEKTVESIDNYGAKTLPKSQLNIELNEVQSFGSVDLIPVTNSSKPEMKIHEKPVKNFVEITPLVSSQNANVSLDKFCDLVEQKEHQNSQEPKAENVSLNVSVIVKNKPSSDAENVGVKKQKELNLDNSNMGKSKKQPKLSFDDAQVDSHCDKKSTSIEQSIGQKQKNISTNQEAPNVGQCNAKKIPKISNIKTVCTVSDQNKAISNDHIKEIANINIPTNEATICGKRVENLGLPKELSENLANDKDLSDELFFPLSHTPNESNPNALSPTAAFLLSFPVVSTTSSSKPTETDNSYSVGTNLLRIEDKQNQPKDHSLFESISFILNDLNDVSDNSKNLSSVDNSGAAHFPNFTNKTRTNIDLERSNALNTVNNSVNKKVISKAESSKSQITNDVKKHQTLPECPLNTMQANNLLSDRTNFMQSKTFENVSNPTENTSDFYVSLSTLGLPSKSAAKPINPSSHFNFQISSLAPRNLIESRSLIADTPFTFSLTKCSDTITNTTKTTSQQQEVLYRPNKTTLKKSTPTKHLINDRFIVPPPEPTSITPLNRCNTFNPFSFDNPSIASASSSITTTPFTFTLTPTFSSISSSTPLLSSHDPLFSSSFDMPIMRSTNTSLTKNLKKENKPATILQFGCNEKHQIQSTSGKIGKNYTMPSTSKSSKNLVNWMTSTVNNKPTQELHLDFISTAPEEPSPWSPNPNTNLIVLHGDLALNTISNGCNVPANKFDLDSKKGPIRTNINHKYGQSKVSTNRQLERSGKGGKSDKNLQTFKIHHQPIQQPINESHTTNKFHSVSQLLDQDLRQTANKNSCYISNESKMPLKDSSMVTTKLKMYPKYEIDASNQLVENKFSTNPCNIVGNSDECDRDLFGGYFFSQPKRLKLNYHTSSEFLGNQSYPTAFENSNANDHLASYSNYQTYDNDCNNVSSTSCINNLSNQTYSYQYTQPHSQSYNQQTQQLPQTMCDPIDSSNYFQTPPVSSLPNYKPSSHFSDVITTRSTTKTSTHQTYSNDNISNVKILSGTTATSNSVSNNQWNDSFSWMPYNFNSTDTKTVTTNNINGNNNNMIPNFNLTTIFPDYNKS
ncbi:putative uncharacterized protein DDB_G0282133 [Contarinia nasturtii]|uniref:putative uncharacterized protein DDB_G0282133 n=1 Tax=Contarinia nasturtii TaxID=265458 RepID=UPI0012D49279|nr:putative uncharacterized protein DDB_G0282133 [Contarinia nasturtii]